MLESIKYSTVVIAIPQKFELVATIGDEKIEELMIEELVIKPSRNIAKIEKLINDTLDKINNYYDDTRRPKFLILNETDYKDFIWYFANQDKYIEVLDDVFGCEIILHNMCCNPSPIDIASEEFYKKHRED